MNFKTTDSLRDRFATYLSELSPINTALEKGHLKKVKETWAKITAKVDNIHVPNTWVDDDSFTFIWDDGATRLELEVGADLDVGWYFRDRTKDSSESAECPDKNIPEGFWAKALTLAISPN